ncbi:polymerase [Methylobacterium tardum]|uniref:Porin n=1 Tax=Methylobacterium tardum TaxID=374432 RepID=A0AA37TSH1_9HYPH|nr:polymerase [Methylobacterium tardum]
MKTSLLCSAAAFAGTGAAHAADLPVKKAVPIEYVRVCGAYGAGFFYIPGTDTCLRISGRARFEGGYEPTYSRQANGRNFGDTAGYRALGRLNMDARTQTAYGTLRAFVRMDMAGRTGGSYGGGTSGTAQRFGQAYAALGIDTFGRAQQYVNLDKAFIQFAGLTAGRASSFFDFYAHDFEFNGYSLGSDVYSTNLLAYTATMGNGLSATISLEDPTYRRTPIFSPLSNTVTPSNGSVTNFGLTNVPTPVFYRTATGALATNTVNVIQANRMPDFVGVLRLDQAWGSAQLSAAVHELNVQDSTVINPSPAGAVVTPHANSVYGWAVQGGLKINAPFIAPGDALYLQGAYANGAQSYTGYCSYTGCESQTSATLQGQKFDQYFNDAVINPITGQLQTSTSFTATASYLHYWSPEWRSAFVGSYGEQDFSAAIRYGQGLVFQNFAGITGTNAIGVPGTRLFQLSQALRDTYQFSAGGSLIWSPVKDLDIGVEAFYTQFGVKSGRVIDNDKDPTAYTRLIANPNAVVRTATKDGVEQFRFRVQRDF